MKGETDSSSKQDNSGINNETHRKWIELQMTPDMNWNILEIDLVKLICTFNISKDVELKDPFNWKNNQPLLKEIQSQKSTKFIFPDYQLQFIIAYQLFKQNEEGYNEDFH